MKRTDCLLLYGGEVDAARLPVVVPAEYFKKLGFLGRMASAYSESQDPMGQRQPMDIVFTRSTSMFSAVTETDEGSLILISIGALARLRVVTRLLLSFWNDDHGVYFATTPLDDLDPSQVKVPSRLHPLFLDHLEDEEFWHRLQELDSSISLPPEASTDVDAVTNLALLFIFLHEVAHIILLHPRFLAEMRTRSPQERDGLSPEEIRKGVELIADELAAASMISTLRGLIAGERAAGRESHPANFFLRTGYALTLVLSLFDTTRKFLAGYSKDQYAHPMARHQLIVRSASHAILRQEPELLAAWQGMEIEAWRRCIWAFHGLTLATMEEPDDREGEHWIVAVPSSMVYGMGAATGEIRAVQEREGALLARVRAVYDRYVEGLANQGG